MKNISEILRDLGIDVPEDKQSELNKAVAKNYKTIAEHEQKTEKLEAELDAVREKLKGFEGVDVESLRGQITTLTSQLEGEKSARQADAARAVRERNVQAFMAGKTFINSITEDSIREKILSALEQNTGESVEQVFARFTTDETGNALPNIFAPEAENRPRFTAPLGKPSGQQYTDRNEIMAIKDSSVRQRAISQNIALFRKDD